MQKTMTHCALSYRKAERLHGQNLFLTTEDATTPHAGTLYNTRREQPFFPADPEPVQPQTKNRLPLEQQDPWAESDNQGLGRMG